MPNYAKFADNFLDNFIRFLEYNPRLKNYLLQKKLVNDAGKAKAGENVVVPVNFKENAQYEKHKRSVDRFNKKAEKANEAYADAYMNMAGENLNHDNWEKLHAKERQAGLNRWNRKLKEAEEFQNMIVDDARKYALSLDPENYVLNNPNENPNVVMSAAYRAVVDNGGDIEKWAQLNKAFRKARNDVCDWEYYNFEDNPAYNVKNPYWYYDDYRFDNLRAIPPKVNIAPMKESPQDYIYRYHTTKAKNLPYIFRSGLDPEKGGEGYGKALLNGSRGFDKSDLQNVYTEFRSPDGAVSGYFPFEDQATIRLKIPKKDYRKMDRIEENPEVDRNFRKLYSNDGFEDPDRELVSVQHGGRTDIFSDKVSPKYIDGIYTSDNEWVDPWTFLENYRCGQGYVDDCDDWYDAIHPFLNNDDDWNMGAIRRLYQKNKWNK